MKSSNRIYWGHKASIIGFPSQRIPLDIVALRDVAAHDRETLFPHIEKLFSEIPEIKPKTKRVLYDSACDDQDFRDQFAGEFKTELKTSLNPRRKKEIVDNLPRSISRITPYGIPICIGDNEMEYKGMRIDEKKYIRHIEHPYLLIFQRLYIASFSINSDTFHTFSIQFLLESQLK